MAATRESQRDIKARLKMLRRPTAPRHWGWKHVTREGKRCLVPNIEERKIMQEIVRLRDVLQLSWPQTCQAIENLLARACGRKPVVYAFGYWTRKRVTRAYKAEKIIQEYERGARERYNERMGITSQPQTRWVRI
jgi:hypothetical protein